MARAPGHRFKCFASCIVASLAFIPFARAEPPESIWSGIDLSLAMHSDTRTRGAFEKDDIGGYPSHSDRQGRRRDKLALAWDVDDDVKFVLPARQLLNIPDKGVMFVLEVGF